LVNINKINKYINKRRDKERKKNGTKKTKHFGPPEHDKNGGAMSPCPHTS
jgi:hypothetical protein